MVGAALHDDAAGAQWHLALVQHQRDLALHHDTVVDALRAVHQRVRRAPVRGGSRHVPDLAETRAQLLGAAVEQLVAVRRNVDEPEARAMP